jgi:signal transduction histidine kinase
VLDNAIRHNKTGGHIDVATATTAAGAVLSVKNSGPTVAPAELERLSQPFQRLGAERTNRGDGHGLGLSIVAAIAQAHNATLVVASRTEGGLRVQVSFPAS